MYGSLVRLPCASLAVAVFDSYTAPFIFNILIESTRLSDFYIFLLEKIAFGFSLGEMDA